MENANSDLFWMQIQGVANDPTSNTVNDAHNNNWRLEAVVSGYVAEK